MVVIVVAVVVVVVDKKVQLARSGCSKVELGGKGRVAGCSGLRASVLWMDTSLR